MAHTHEFDCAACGAHLDTEKDLTQHNLEHHPKFAPNPPRTVTGKNFAAPKFGSAGSGGAEYEPGPERD